MARDPLGDSGDAPDPDTILEALDDEDCRAFLTHLETPMTASELSETCDVPLSTTYRKLDLLTEASLLAERTEIRKDGQHTTRYAVDFDALHITLENSEADGPLALALDLERPERSPDEQLAAMWSEVRKET
ncbi:MAG: helix-turn-helix domain-containing protein [Halodesulfurarchaeum sp.]